MSDAAAWTYLTVEDPGAGLVRLRDNRGNTVWGLRPEVNKAGAIIGISIVSADGKTGGVLHHRKGSISEPRYANAHALYGMLRRDAAGGGVESAGNIELLLPVGGLSYAGRLRFNCREMIPIYGDDKKFQYHVLLGSRTRESYESPAFD